MATVQLEIPEKYQRSMSAAMNTLKRAGVEQMCLEKFPITYNKWYDSYQALKDDQSETAVSLWCENTIQLAQEAIPVMNSQIQNFMSSLFES